MIVKILIPILLLLLVSDAYVYLHFLRHMKRNKIAAITAWAAQSMAMVAYSVVMALLPDFAPADMDCLNFYLLLLGVWAVPKFVFTVCSILGWGHCVYHKTKTNWGNYAGILAGVILAVVCVYGFTKGFNKVTVRHVTFESADLPEAFDGYRIVQFSDAHVGTYTGQRAFMLKVVADSINSQKADMIAFTGDLQNMRPSELYQHEKTLASLKAKDGVFSVLGNHDYAYYIKATEAERRHNCQEIIDVQRRMGWKLLLNDNCVIRRGNDSIVVAGMEFEGESPRVPSFGNLKKTLHGVNQKGAFILMLQHDPTSWRTDILPHSTSQLTLSGHTHAGQMKFFGWSPASLKYDEWGGLYTEGRRAINVSCGVGGFVPFRLGCPGEIVVIELKKHK